MPDDERGRPRRRPSPSCAAPRSPTTHGSAPAASAPSSASSTRRCGRSATGLPRLQHRPDHEARPLLAGVLLPVLRQQGRRVPPARRAGRAPGRARRPRRSTRSPPDADGLGGACAPGSRATPRSTRATSRCSTRSRATTRSATVARQHRRRDDHPDPRAAGDGDAAAPPARPGDPAAARDLQPHARRQRHPALDRARRVPGRAGRARASPTSLHRTLFGLRADVNVHAADGPAAAGARVRPRDGRAAPRRRRRTGSDGSGNAALVALLASGRERVRRARLPQHPRRRPRRGGGRVARRLLPLLPEQGGARPHPHRARRAGGRDAW